MPREHDCSGFHPTTIARTANGSYRSLWMTLMAETHIDEAPSGDMDKNIVLAAERLFPTLDYGTFGARTSLINPVSVGPRPMPIRLMTKSRIAAATARIRMPTRF